MNKYLILIIMLLAQSQNALASDPFAGASAGAGAGASASAYDITTIEDDGSVIVSIGELVKDQNYYFLKYNRTNKKITGVSYIVNWPGHNSYSFCCMNPDIFNALHDQLEKQVGAELMAEAKYSEEKPTGAR